MIVHITRGRDVERLAPGRAIPVVRHGEPDARALLPVRLAHRLPDEGRAHHPARRLDGNVPMARIHRSRKGVLKPVPSPVREVIVLCRVLRREGVDVRVEAVMARQGRCRVGNPLQRGEHPLARQPRAGLNHQRPHRRPRDVRVAIGREGMIRITEDHLLRVHAVEHGHRDRVEAELGQHEWLERDHICVVGHLDRLPVQPDLVPGYVMVPTPVPGRAGRATSRVPSRPCSRGSGPPCPRASSAMPPRPSG